MADYYYCLRDSAHATTVGQNTTADAIVFIMQNLSPAIDFDVTTIPIPFADQYLMDLISPAESISFTGKIPCNSVEPFTNIENALNKIREIRDIASTNRPLKLNSGSWEKTTTTWTYSGALGLPNYPPSGLDMILRQITATVDVGEFPTISFTARLDIGESIV